MTPQQIDLVQSSFKKVVPIAGTAADLFYDRLFEIAPEVRSLFPQDLGEQKKKLMTMLGTAVANLHKLETILPAVKDLGSRHKGYGVTAAHYAPVGAALLWTLGEGPRSRLHAGGESGVDRDLYGAGRRDDGSVARTAASGPLMLFGARTSRSAYAHSCDARRLEVRAHERPRPAVAYDY